jgi:lipoate-protein ligase A
MNSSIILSPSHDPWFNLALEEHLLATPPLDRVRLYLWQNEHTVVIGRHQNAWKECACRLLEDEGGRLARRPSGGGAVYHDLGNLNFTFIAPDNEYNLQRQLQVILSAVRRLGIECEFSGRNDIVAQGRKFSGNAFFQRKGQRVHHGTILVGADFSRLGRYLQVSAAKMASKGVTSVKARVVNLADLKPGLGTDLVMEALTDEFAREYSAPRGVLTWNPDDPELEHGRDKHSSWDWRYGRTPNFDLSLETRFPWGGLELGFTLAGGRVQSVHVFSDAMQTDIVETLAHGLKDRQFRRADLDLGLEEFIRTMDHSPEALDVSTWLEKELSSLTGDAR